MFLWYTLKLQRYQQKTLIERHLLSETSVDAESPSNAYSVTTLSKISKMDIRIPFLYRHSKFFCKPKRIFFVLESVLFLSWIIVLIETLKTSFPVYGSQLVSIILFILIFIMIILICALWCCNNNNNKLNEGMDVTQKFRDDFKFRLEITLLLIILISMTLSLKLITTYYGNDSNSKNWSKVQIYILMTQYIAQSIGQIVQIFVPYITYKKYLSKFNKTQKESTTQTTITVLDILQSKY